MKILVSACIMGECCKYNGKSNKNQKVIDILQNQEVLAVCTEVLYGMLIPRPCAEMIHGIVIDENGNNVHDEYSKAVQKALWQIADEEITYAVLQSRSPTCGENQIYDGAFEVSRPARMDKQDE